MWLPPWSGAENSRALTGRSSSRSVAARLLVAFALLVGLQAATSCAQYTGTPGSSRGATEDVVAWAGRQDDVRSIDVQITNTSEAVAFDEVGFALESGEWVAEPAEDLVVAPGSRTSVMAEAMGPQDPVAGYLTLVSASSGNLTVQFQNDTSGPSVEVQGSLADRVSTVRTRTENPEQAAFLVIVEPASAGS